MPMAEKRSIKTRKATAVLASLPRRGTRALRPAASAKAMAKSLNIITIRGSLSGVGPSLPHQHRPGFFVAPVACHWCRRPGIEWEPAGQE
ncbi:MAG: hypothetical protein G01um101416_936 [Microgenomates group bacterium Gr01-1014_16]|nr:MAG: hypothetical protein G01um101416_936 [Microgenomates group bacterium Gr01-1014_16]